MARNATQILSSKEIILLPLLSLIDRSSEIMLMPLCNLYDRPIGIHFENYSMDTKPDDVMLDRPFGIRS